MALHLSSCCPQSVEHDTLNLRVVDSSPALGADVKQREVMGLMFLALTRQDNSLKNSWGRRAGETQAQQMRTIEIGIGCDMGTTTGNELVKKGIGWQEERCNAVKGRKPYA